MIRRIFRRSDTGRNGGYEFNLKSFCPAYQAVAHRERNVAHRRQSGRHRKVDRSVKPQPGQGVHHVIASSAVH